MNRSQADVLIIGNGFAGIVAANRLADAGVDVTLLDENIHIGGQLLRQLPERLGRACQPPRPREKGRAAVHRRRQGQEDHGHEPHPGAGHLSRPRGPGRGKREKSPYPESKAYHPGHRRQGEISALSRLDPARGDLGRRRAGADQGQRRAAGPRDPGRRFGTLPLFRGL